MTDTLATHTLDLDRLLSGRLRAVRKVIDDRVSDAAAHALAALTPTLRQTPDGRATVQKIRRSARIKSAADRLDSLGRSLNRMALDIREQVYVDSLEFWADSPDTHPEIRREGVIEPTAASVQKVRKLVLHGLPVETEITKKIGDIQHALSAVVAQAAGREVRGGDAGDLIDTWEIRAIKGLAEMMLTILTDSVTVAGRMGQRDVMRPELLEDDPMLD